MLGDTTNPTGREDVGGRYTTEKVRRKDTNRRSQRKRLHPQAGVRKINSF